MTSAAVGRMRLRLRRWQLWPAHGSRSSRALATALMSVINRMVSFVGILITYPLVLNTLGTERFGLWVTLSSAVIYLRLVDAGATSGFQALVSQAHGVGRDDRIRALVSSAYMILSCVAAILLGLAALTPFFDLQSLLRLPDQQAGGEAVISLAIIFTGLALNFPAQVARQVRLGLQQGAAANAWDTAATVGTFVGQIATIMFGGGLIMLVAVTALMPPFVNTINSIVYWRSVFRYRPQWLLVERSVVKSIGGTGVNFLMLGLSQALAIQIDTPLVAANLGVEAVADYAIVMKLFTQPQVFLVFFLAAHFPAYIEALSAGDFVWVRRQFLYTLIFGFGLSAGCCLSLYIVARPLISLWIGRVIDPPELLLQCAALCGLASATAQIIVYFLFAVGQRYPIIVAHIFMIPLNIGLALFLLPRMGSAGVCLAIALGYIGVLTVPNLLRLKGTFERLPIFRDRALAGSGLEGAIEESSGEGRTGACSGHC